MNMNMKTRNPPCADELFRGEQARNLFAREANGELCSLCSEKMHSDTQRIIETPANGLIHADCWHLGFAKAAGFIDEALAKKKAWEEYEKIVKQVRGRLRMDENLTFFQAIFRLKVLVRIYKIHNKHIIARANKKIPEELLSEYHEAGLIKLYGEIVKA